MKIQGSMLTSRIIEWLEQKKFKYNMDLQKSDPLRGCYYLSFTNKQEELIARLAWGLV